MEWAIGVAVTLLTIVLIGHIAIFVKVIRENGLSVRKKKKDASAKNEPPPFTGGEWEEP